MKASSESGLCAMLISRVDAMPLAESLLSGASARSFQKVFRRNSCLLLADTLVSSRDSGSQHDLDHFREHEPVKAEACCLGERVGQHRQPRKASGEQHHFSQHACGGGASESGFAALHDPARQPGDEGIGQQEAAGRT